MFQINNDHLDYFFVFDGMTKKDKAITLSYCKFFKKAMMGEYARIFPSIPKIAEMSGCCPRTVNKFIKKYEKKLFIHRRVKDKQTNKNKSNEYQLNQDFFEFIILLEVANLLHRWNKVKTMVVQGLSEREHFLCSYLYEKGQLSTTKMRAGYMPKMRCIRSYSSYLILMKKVPRTEPALKAVVQNKAFEEINDLPLSFSDKERLILTHGLSAIREARKDFFFYGNKHKIDNPMGFMLSRAKAHTIELLKL